MIESDYQTESRMSQKLKAIPIPDLKGKNVLDLGCDFGWWSQYALQQGASRVVGVDRGRYVRNHGYLDLIKICRELMPEAKFYDLNLGKQYHEYGRFDVIFMFSLYHHCYEAAGGDHNPIWFWLSRHLKPGGIVLWENPTGIDDPVVQMNVQRQHWTKYNTLAIMEASSQYFSGEFIGPALHESTRSVYRFTKVGEWINFVHGEPQEGSAGATKAWVYDGRKRMYEVEAILGVKCLPGSLNLTCPYNFDWEHDYYRAQILDPRGNNSGEWKPRWCRFYPVEYYEHRCWAMRFEGETYPLNFVELISDERLRDIYANRSRSGE